MKMAEVSNNDVAKETYSSFLFTKDDGSSMVFRLHPCQEKTQLRTLIEAGGGCMTSDGTGASDVFSLILPNITAKSDNMVSSSYIHDCIKANKLLDIADYRVAQGYSFDSPLCSLNMQSKSLTGRSTYFFSEDKAILEFLLKNNAVGDTGGNAVWKQMESYKVIRRTWQSAKDRFRKYILPNIKRYTLTHEEIEKFLKKDSHRDNQSSRTYSVENSSSTEEGNALNVDGVDNSATNDEPDEFDENLIQHARAVEELDGTDQCMAADVTSPKGTVGCRETKMAKLRSIHSGRTNEALRSGFAKRDLKLAKVCQVEVVRPSTRSSSGRSCEENQAGIENIASTDAENESSGGNVEQRASNQNDSKRCRAEVALVDSQTSEESDSHQKRKRAGKLRPGTLRDSPARVKPTGKLFPNTYSPRLCSSAKRDEQMTISGKQKAIRPSETCSQDSVEADTLAATQTDISHFSTDIRRFVMNPSSDVAEMNNSEPSSVVNAEDENINAEDENINAEDENKLATCDELLKWLNIAPATFAHAVFQSNGSVDSAVELLLGNGAQLWDADDDANLINSKSEIVIKNVHQKYGKQSADERAKFLEDNPIFVL